MKNTNRRLLKGSIALLVLFNIFNILNFVFQFFMAHALSVVEYGILTALLSISFMFSLFSESIQAIVARFVSRTKSSAKIHGFLNSSFRRYSLVALAVFVVYLLASIFLVQALNIPFWLLALNGLMVFVVFITPVTYGAMQGKKQFLALGWNLILSSAAKLLIAIAFIFIGWKVGGAITAGILGGCVSLILAFIPLRGIFRARQVTAHNPVLGRRSLSIFALFALLFIFYSLDVIIAKMMFDPVSAGYYALASVLAKTIFIGTQPISKAMFPFSAQAKAEKKAAGIFYKSAGILLACALLALVIFYFFPGFLLMIFAGKVVPEAASIIFYIGIATTLISVVNLVLFYKISIGRTASIPVFAICLLAEIALLYVFSGSLISFSIAFILASAIFLWASIQV